MNESHLIISNTCIIPHNLIALTIAFIKNKTKLSYIDLKKKINNRMCVEYTYIQTNVIDTSVRIVLCNLGQLNSLSIMLHTFLKLLSSYVDLNFLKELSDMTFNLL